MRRGMGGGASAGAGGVATNANASAGPPRCLNSGLPTRYGNTFATPDDYREYQARVANEIADLTARGFTQSPTVPNLFTKSGLAITLEDYRRDKDGVLGAHAALVAGSAGVGERDGKTDEVGSTGASARV